MRYYLRLAIFEEDGVYESEEFCLDFGGDDFSSGTLVSTALQALIPGLVGQVYTKLDEKRNPELYKTETEEKE